MLLSLLMMVLSFIASKASGNSTKQALGHSLLAGAATHLVTTQTEWGKDLSASFDEFIGVSNGDNSVPRVQYEADEVSTGEVDENGNPVVITIPKVQTPDPTRTGGSLLGNIADIWNDMSPAGKALAGAGTAYVASSFLDKYGLWILGGLAAFFILKD